MKRLLLIIFVACLAVPASAKEVEFTLQSIDDTLARIAPHARGFPPTFASVDERKQIEADLRRLLVLLDAAVVQLPNETDLLFRAGFANAMGHNLDFSGCAEKSIAAYEKFLKLKPDDKIGNYYYGGFLAGTATRRQDSIKYLEKALSLGVTDAHYTLAFVYLGQADKQKALLHLKKYAEANPKETWIKEKIAQVEKAEIRIHNEPPPNYDEMTKKKEPARQPKTNQTNAK